MTLAPARARPSRLAPAGLSKHGRWAVLAACGLAVLMYGATLMTIIAGCSADYCADVGEFQVALPLWGTVHHTGYPLYMLIGSPFVAVLRWLGVAPAAGASLYSLAWEAAAVAGLAGLALRLGAQPVLALAAGWLFAAIEPIWVHGSLAEVYGLSMAFTVAIVWWCVQLGQRWTDRGGLLLALLAGLGVAHHRLIAVVLPAVSLYLLPAAPKGARLAGWLALAGLCFMAGFLPYVDMPLRVWLGSQWNYGQPAAWDGFWYIFWGREVSHQMRPVLEAAPLAQAAREVAAATRNALGWPGVVVCSLGVAAALWPGRARREAWLLAAIAVSYLAFAVVFRPAVLLEADLMALFLAVALLLALGLSRLPRPAWLAAVGAALLAAGWLTYRNYPVVRGLTRDASAVDYIRRVDALEAPPQAVVMAPWGMPYFALAYAQRVEGRWPGWQVVDHRADLRALAAGDGYVYTAAETAYVFDRAWWAERLGEPLRVTSAGPELVAIRSQPLPAPAGQFLAVGDGIGLTDWRIAPLADGRLDVTLYWTCRQTPVRDYSTFVHVTDQDDLRVPGDLMAQSDSAAPVYGWAPTTTWLPNEVIREDHAMALPAGRAPRFIFAGLYSRDPAGAFVPLGRLRFGRGEAGAWEYVP